MFGNPAGAALKRSSTQPLQPLNAGSSFLSGSTLGAGTPASSSAGPSLPSLFTSTAAAPPSLFAQSTAAQPPQLGNSVFGLGSSTTQPPRLGGSVFGLGSSTTQPALGAAAQPTQHAGNLFGATASQPQPTVFSSINAPAAQPTGSLFQSTAAPSVARPPASGTLFASLGASAAPAQNPDPKLKMSSYFDNMVERGKKRNTVENGGLADLPSIQLGLADIARKARNLGTGGPSAAAAKAGAADARA